MPSRTSVKSEHRIDRPGQDTAAGLVSARPSVSVWFLRPCAGRPGKRCMSIFSGLGKDVEPEMRTLRIGMTRPRSVSSNSICYLSKGTCSNQKRRTWDGLSPVSSLSLILVQPSPVGIQLYLGLSAVRESFWASMVFGRVSFGRYEPSSGPSLRKNLLLGAISTT